MNLHRLFATSMLFASAVLPVTAEIASAQVYAPPRLYPAVDFPVRSVSRSHSFELFNDSDQDLLYLYIYDNAGVDQEAAYGGIRQLPPGSAWKINLGRGCIYDVMAEYEDGSQVYYDDVDTCNNLGMQLI